MRTFLATFLLLFCSLAGAAAMVARDSEGTIVTVYDKPCTNEAVLAQLEWVNTLLASAGLPRLTEDDLERADVTYKGKKFEACWALGREFVLVIDEEGLPTSAFIVPTRDFVPAQEI